MSKVMDRFGNELDEWPRCLFCDSPLGLWPGNRYFCKNCGCPLWCMPAEWTVEIAKVDTAVILKNKLAKALEDGWHVVRYGVGYDEPTDF